MEMKRLSICLALFVLAYVSRCSEGRHSLVRREADDVNYDDPTFLQNDEGGDDEAQNDGEGGEDEEESVVAKIETVPAIYNVTLGRTVRLECKVSPTENVVVQWTKNNTKLFFGTQKSKEQELKSYGLSDRFAIAANSTDLLIKDVRPSDIGVYTCKILQQLNPVEIQHNLLVLEKPRILSFRATGNGQLVEGSDLQLTCDVSGSPPPKIVWSRDEDNVNKNLQENDASFVGNSIIIRNVTRFHSGKYYCYVFNGVGTNQSELNVVVRGKPRVHITRPVVNSAIGVEAILECAVHGDASHIRWYMNGSRIEDSSRAYTVSTDGQRSNLSVTPQQDSDFGTFTCEAENEQGSHNRSIDLVQSPVLDNLDVDGPKISLTIHSHQPLQIIELQLRELDGDSEWKTLNIPLPQSSNPHEYKVDYSLENDLTNGGKYEVTVKVKNEKSWSTHTDPVVIEYESRPQPIQHASVYRSGPNNSSSYLTSPMFLIAALMYLLVRM